MERILTGSALAARLLESMVTELIDFNAAPFDARWHVYFSAKADKSDR